MDYSLPGSFVHGIIQARVSELAMCPPPKPLVSLGSGSCPYPQICLARSTHTPNPTAPPLPVLSSSSSKVQFSSATQSCLTLCDPMDCSTPGLPVHHQLQSLLKLTSIKLVMPSNHLILCCPLLPPSIFPSIRVFPNKGRANFS